MEKEFNISYESNEVSEVISKDGYNPHEIRSNFYKIAATVTTLLLASSLLKSNEREIITIQGKNNDPNYQNPPASLPVIDEEKEEDGIIDVSEVPLEETSRGMILLSPERTFVLNTSPAGYAKPPVSCDEEGCIWNEIGHLPISDEYLPARSRIVNPEEYLKIVNYFNVDNSENKRYERSGTRRDPRTYCNVFASDVTKAMGVEIPRFIYENYKTKQFSAAHQYNWLHKEGEELGWVEISSEEAIEYANMGYPTVVSHPDHITVAIPGEPEEYQGVMYPRIAQSGWDNSSSVNFTSAYLRFFYPERQEEPLDLEEDIRDAQEEREKIKFFTNTKQYRLIPYDEARNYTNKYAIENYEKILIPPAKPEI